jgi:hypothetical protein
MKTLRRCQTWTAFVASLAWAAPVQHVGWAQESSATRNQQQLRPEVVDVALGRRGRLSGQVINPTGARVSGAAVVIRHDDQRVAEMTTDANGRFAVEGLRSGIYRVSAPNAEVAVRAWAAGTAPPAASDEIPVVSDEVVQPADQYPTGRLRTGRIVLVGLVIAAAIAIPVSIHNSTHNDPPAS